MAFWKKFFSRKQSRSREEELRYRIQRFQSIVQHNNRVLELISDAGEKLGGEYIFDNKYLADLASTLEEEVRNVVVALNELTDNAYPELLRTVGAIDEQLKAIIEARLLTPASEAVLRIDNIGIEHTDVAGAKMSRLGELVRLLGLNIPPGVVVTAHACSMFLEQAEVDTLLPALEKAHGQELLELAEEARRKVLESSLPQWLERKIKRAVRGLTRRTGSDLFAIRSSAIGEDEDVVFAGQYLTVLGVKGDDVLAAYRKVVSSLFSRGVMEYRMSHDLSPVDGLMAVGIQILSEPIASGVVYTLDPNKPEDDTMLVSAGWGLGASVVDGSLPVDRFIVSRMEPFEIVEAKLTEKTHMIRTSPSGGKLLEPVPEEQRSVPALEPEQISKLCRIALKIERYMRCAQDIEWLLNREGEIQVLQARQLRLFGHATKDRIAGNDKGEHEVLMKNKGEVACRGVGWGPVWLADGLEEEQEMPEQAVIVSRTASPKLAALLPRASALVTDLGTTTGHLATVAREFRIPAIVDTREASKVLPQGELVTVDTEDNVVYKGAVSSLIKWQLLESSSYEDKREFRTLRRMLRHIAVLNLNDPSSPSFSSDNCRTYHDVIRFAHEVAVNELTRAKWLKPTRKGRFIYKLDTDIPIDLYIVDIGGGVAEPGANGTTIRKEDIMSMPLSAILRGLTKKGVWRTEPADMDLGGFMSSATSAASLTLPGSIQPEQNVAIVSRDYLNLNLKLGYHFNLVDCRMCEKQEENFIYFRFAGGVTEQLRRSRRASLISEILASHDFMVQGKGDLVTAGLKSQELAVMQEKLEMIGRLIGFTRQLDIHLRSDEIVEKYVEEFLNNGGFENKSANGMNKENPVEGGGHG